MNILIRLIQQGILRLAILNLLFLNKIHIIKIQLQHLNVVQQLLLKIQCIFHHFLIINKFHLTRLNYQCYCFQNKLLWLFQGHLTIIDKPGLMKINHFNLHQLQLYQNMPTLSTNLILKQIHLYNKINPYRHLPRYFLIKKPFLLNFNISFYFNLLKLKLSRYKVPNFLNPILLLYLIILLSSEYQNTNLFLRSINLLLIYKT